MKNKKGFTLIEMLIVVAIIAILSGLILTGLNKARMQSRDARRMADIKNIQAQLEVFYNANNRYPSLTEFSDGKTIQPLKDSQGNSYVYCVDNSNNAQHYVVGTTSMEQRVVNLSTDPNGTKDGCDTSNCSSCSCCDCANQKHWCASL
jgi:prepilin-type N-terminal cleavage/methylation domain-containing protein